MSRRKNDRSAATVNHLRQLYGRPATMTAASVSTDSAGAGSAKSQPTDFELSDQDQLMARLIKRDIIKTLVITFILIILLTAVYSIRDTAFIQNAVKQLASYTGF